MRRTIAIIIGLAFIFSFGQQAQEQEEMEFKPEIGLNAVAGKIGGLYVVDGYGINPGFGLWADLGKLSQNIGLDGGVEYWFGSKEEASQTTKLSNLSIYLTIRLDFPVEEFTPFIGVGLGIDMYSKTPEFGAEEKRTNLEPHIDMGTRYPIHPKMDLEGRIKANFSDWTSYALYVSAIFKLGESGAAE